MATPTGNSEGKISFPIRNVNEECFTWYKTFGDIHNSLHAPLIFLHGGPGAGHVDHLSISEPLLASGIPTIFYDQLGCGNSSRVLEKVEDESFWGFDVFCTQLDSLVDHLKLREHSGFSLLGHSWGGMLASEYSSRQPHGLKKLVIANSAASAKMVAKERERLLRELPVGDDVIQMDVDVDFDNPKLQEAVAKSMQKHFCTVPMSNWPSVLTDQHWNDCTPMWPKNGKQGISAIRMPSFMADFEVTETAGRIQVPTLLLSGRFDTNTDPVIEPWFQLIPRVKWAVLEKSGHFPVFEEHERYVELLKNFLETDK